MSAAEAEATPTQPLLRLARAAGVQPSYVDNGGVRRQAGTAALLGVLHALGVEVRGPDDAARALAEVEGERRPSEAPVVVALDGAATTSVEAGAQVELQLEDGSAVQPTVSPDGTVTLSELPAGAHRLWIDGRAASHVLSSPTRLAGSRVPRRRRLGVFAPTYALRRHEGDRGMGDLRDLEATARWADEHGGALVATLPLLPTFLGDGAEPFEPSPYSPVSRVAWNEAYLDLAALPGASSPPPAGGAPGDVPPLVDWRQQGVVVREALDAAAAALGDRGWAAVDAWGADRPDVASYARFRAATQRHGPWPTWPTSWQQGDLTDAELDHGVERRHLLAQWAMDQQLGELAGTLQERRQLLYLDLPIGAHPDGFDTWHHRSSFATGVSVGAPPDAFFAKGQDWGFPPLHPARSQADGHAYLRACIAHHLRHAGMLRIDHVMAVHRLWWVPPGLPADQGAYVTYPAEELYAAILLEAERAGAEVVGEDLGTVPGEVRRSLGRHGLLGMHALQFELPSEDGEAPPAPRRRDLALLNTHDMATFDAFWTAADVDLRAELGLLDDGEADDERQRRAAQRWAVASWLARTGDPVDRPTAPAVLEALVRHLGRGPARWVLLTLEDLWSEQQPQNVPGVAGDRYPSWRHRARIAVDDLPEVAPLLDCLHTARGAPT